MQTAHRSLNGSKPAIRTVLAMALLATALVLGINPAASAEPAPPDHDAPGSTYHGPDPYPPGPPRSCASGRHVGDYHLETQQHRTAPAFVRVWFSTRNSGTFCAATFDNINDRRDRYINLHLYRPGWRTAAYDRGYFRTYAGAMAHNGPRLRANAVNILSGVHQAVGSSLATIDLRCRYLASRPAPYCINYGYLEGGP